MHRKKKIVIIGAGPAGLAAAYEITRLDHLKNYDVVVVEKENQVGGLAKTLTYKKHRFDIGGHRFYTKFEEINKFYKNYLGKQMLIRKRLSRIYYNGKFYDYPLSAANALSNLGLFTAVLIFFSWLFRQFRHYKVEKTFDQWVSNRFGDMLFKIFFKSYTEKVWGIPTSKLSAEWASQRIQNLDLLRAVWGALTGSSAGTKTMIKKFYYPKYGPGLLYDRLKNQLVEKGVVIKLNIEVVGLSLTGNKITQVIVNSNGKLEKIDVDTVVSTMPFNQIIAFLKPNKQLAKMIRNLKFRNFISVNWIIKSNPFPDQWIYIHDPKIKVGRIQNFKNWSPYMSPDRSSVPVGMEYFCNKDDDLWKMDDKKLIELSKKEFLETGLVKRENMQSAFVYRVENAYPIYNFGYQKPYQAARRFASKFKNLHLCGRGGLFRYNNQDHSILTGFYVARNIVTNQKKFDVWSIGEEEGYLENPNTD